MNIKEYFSVKDKKELIVYSRDNIEDALSELSPVCEDISLYLDVLDENSIEEFDEFFDERTLENYIDELTIVIASLEEAKSSLEGLL